MRSRHGMRRIRKFDDFLLFLCFLTTALTETILLEKHADSSFGSRCVYSRLKFGYGRTLVES